MKNDGIYNAIAGLVEKAKQAMKKEEPLIETTSLRKIQRLVEEGLANLEREKEHEVKKMEEVRKEQIALALTKHQLKETASLRGISNLKREIGNLVREPEMVAIDATPGELLDFMKDLLQEIFMEQIKTIS